MQDREKEYLEWLSSNYEILNKLYKPITSDSTRKLAIQVLVFSILLLIVSFDILKLKDINISGYNFEFVTNKNLLLCGGITICIYLLFLYVTDLYSDWNSSKDLSFLKINIALEQEAKLKEKELNDLILLSNKIMQSRKDKFQELDEFINTQRKETEILIEKIQIDKITKYEEVMELSDNLNRKLQEKENQVYKEIQNDNLQVIATEIENFHKNSFLNEKLKLLNKTLSKHKTLKDIRFIVEVIIPIIFCVLSIYFGVKTLVK